MHERRLSNPLIIAGFHRSGTSMCAEILNRSGLFLGESLLGGNESNPYGHFEDTEIVHFHERILSDQSRAWYLPSGPLSTFKPKYFEWINSYLARRNSCGQPYGFKDPRICLTIRLWATALGQADVLYIHRSPFSSVTSMWRRANADYRKRQAESLNGILKDHPDLIAQVYIENAISMLSFFRTADALGHKVLMVDYRDIVGGLISLPTVTASYFDLDLKDIDVLSVYDATAVNSSRFTVRLRPEFEQILDRLDNSFAEMCRKQADTPGISVSSLAEDALKEQQEVIRLHDLRSDYEAYRLFAERVRKDNLNARVKRDQVELEALNSKLDSLQNTYNELAIGSGAST